MTVSTFWARGSECKDWRMCSHMVKVVSGFRLTVAFSSGDSALYHSEQGSVTAGPCQPVVNEGHQSRLEACLLRF